MKTMIEMQNVSKTFKNEDVLKNVNIKLSDNCIYGVVGRNGSGKSVLFKLISGYMGPDTGKIIVDGKTLNEKYSFPEKMGVLIEKPGFLWQESAMANLKYLAGIRNEISEEEIRKAIQMVGLDPDSKKKTGKFSLGMKQRLGIAQAIMESPDILILDEPFNGLDEDAVNNIRNLILKYKKENRVIILSSHNKDDIEFLCDETYEVKNGKVKLLIKEKNN